MPECLDDYVGKDIPARIVDAFVNELNLGALGFEGVDPAITGRPGYHPSVLSSRQLEREAQRNVELMWLTGLLTPDFKTIADFRRDKGKARASVMCAAASSCCAVK